jgi:hypothetical protein
MSWVAVTLLAAGMAPAATVAAVLPLAGPGQQSAASPDPPAVKDPVLRKELLARMKEDQDYRMRLTPLMQKQAAGDKEARREFEALVKAGQEIDKKNTAWMKGVIEKHGWPGNSLVGGDGALAAWLLVQHADLDPPFQKKCLALLTEAVKKKEASPGNLAYLTDRVRLKEGKKQLYGTQMHQVDGKMVPQPIEDEAHVDQRRKEAGLGPLADYLKFFKEPPAEKKDKK